MEKSKQPIPADLARRFANLSPAKRALLQQRLKAKGLEASVQRSIPRRAISEPAPLSFAQQRLWFLQQYEANSSVYNVPSALRLRGRLDSEALQRSLNEIARRHETLRTTFAQVNGEPIQVIAPSINVALPVVDLTGSPEITSEDEAGRVAADEARRNFDLARDPGFRALLIRLRKDDHLLVLVMHHIVSDGWSVGVFHRELSVLYQAFSRSEPAPLPELAIQYADYALWQRQWLTGEILEAQLSYWKKQLQGIPGVLNLPTDRPRPAVQSYRGARQSIEFSEELSKALEALSRKEGVTLFMTLLAAFQILLYRYSGQQDILVGSPIANRNRTDIEALIGFFVNTLVLRADLSGNPSFRELLQRVSTSALAAYEHQDLPFEKLVEELKPERSLSHSPLFQVMFVLQNAPASAWQLDGLRVSPQRLGAETAKFDLTLSIHQESKGLRASLRYRTDLFDEATAIRILGHYHTVLREIVANADQRIDMLRLMNTDERGKLLDVWSSGSAPLLSNGRAGAFTESSGFMTPNPDLTAGRAVELTLAQRIAEWARCTPDAAALVALGRAPLTYAQLDAHIHSVAAQLYAVGIRRNDRVALLLPNGPEMASAFLAVAASGATCAPLNPSYRAAELDFYLSDLKAKAIIVQSATAPEAVSVAGARGIRLIELKPQPGAQAGLFALEAAAGSAGAEEVARAEDIALVLHTSGTTARPKLVPLTHANLVLSASNVQAAFNLTPSDRSLNIMPLFHIHGLVGSLLSSLMAGASVVCTPGFSAPEFFRWLEEFCPTWYTAVPTMHQAIAARAPSNAAAIRRCPLRFIRSCSAALPPQLMRELENAFGAPVIESYGMTEATHQIASNTLPPGRRKEGSVGQAAGVELRIVDGAGNALPAGQTGEVVVRGPSVTAGYENNSAANAATFVGGWFRTGDQGHLDADGYLFLTGRLKEIINRGGEKISPREVDELLLSHPAVAQAVTFAVPSPLLGEEVAAAVVLREHATATERELREFAAKRLADFKVPRQVVIVGAIPVGPSGKLQRINLAEKLGLSAVDQTRALEPRIVEPAKTVLETQLASIWAQVLRLENVGRQDNFFELGGDSLLAAQVIARVRTSFQVEVSFIDFFEIPTVAGLARCVERIKETQHSPRRLPVRPSSATDTFPLSSAQQALWFLDQLSPGNPANNRPAALRLSGALDIGALEQSLSEIVSRHEALRTVYPVVGDLPMQVIKAPAPVSLTALDLSAVALDDREARAREVAVEEARRPFELPRGPMLRATLLKLAEREHILIVIMHHIASDGWSSEVFFRELAICYNAFSAGTAPGLQPLCVQYADYALWEKEWLSGNDLEQLLSYWKQQIGQQLPRLNFSNSRSDRSSELRRGATQVLNLPGTLATALQTFSKTNNVTLFMTLLAAFKTLLYRYTGQDDLMIGTPVAARKLEEFEGVIGDFINLLPLRSNLSGKPSFRQVLHGVRNTTLQAYEHQDLPLARLAEALRAERGIDMRAGLQVVFNLRNFPVQSVVFAGLQTAPFGFDHGIARFELSLEITETPDGLSCSFEHDTAVLDRATIARLMSGFETLLKKIVADPDLCTETFSLQAEAERRLIPQEGNAARPHISLQRPVHSLFEMQAARKPTATAVLYDGNGLSYTALNRRANQLAHFLRDLGVGPETLVGICAERSLEMAIGVLGTLKAGGAYVPLDPHYPAERLAFMLQDSAVRVILTQQRLLPVLPPHNARVIALDADWQAIARQSEENPQSLSLAGHPAYVIYTSGSTGQPKGVLVTHGGVVNHSLAVAELFNLRPQDRIAQCSSLSFDISVEELFSTWISGAAVVLCPAEKFLPDEEFTRWIASEEITVLNLPTPFWHEWVTALQSRQKPVSELLRLVVVGGDKARCDVLALWRSIAAPQGCWLNTYGPTEATVTTTAYAETLGATAEATQISIPIGRPIAGAQVYVLDGNLSPVPIGITGELYIAGAGLARGYLNRPELTSERFIPNPFAGEPGMRLYRTGDLCRYLPDGNIEFLGRTDRQVKIRGFRIELEEIECKLAEHPGVREAAVVAREDEAGAAKRLVAYVIAAQSAAVRTQELRSFLKDKLPEYMVPSAFVFLDFFPLTPSGKLDRKALPAPGGRRLEQDESLVVPATPVQEMLAGIWAEVLKVEEVGIRENFFDLGGHSLLATQVMSGVRKLFQVELPLRSLFEAPTVAGLADRIEEALREEGGMPVPAVVPRSRNHDLPLSFAQQRLWFLDRLEPNRAVYNLPAVLRIRGPLNVIALEQSLNEIVRRHEALRTTFPAIEGKPVQIITPPSARPLVVTNLRECAESEREDEARRLAKEEARRPFDLARGPLFRTTLIQVSEDDHILVLAMHHIVSDGWSMGVLHRELSALYQAFSHFQPSPLPELTVQYADYALWQREWLQGRVLETQISYWRNQLHGISTLQLPTDRPRPAMQSYRGGRQSLHLSRETTDRLKALSRAEGVTLFMTLLAAFQTLLHLYTGQNDIVVGSPIAGRNRQESEGLIGFFVNTLVLRTDVSGNLKFKELLGRVRKTALEAYEHQDLPFEKLVEELQPERNLSHSPLVQVMFVLQNASANRLKCEGLTVTPVGLGSETAKFDLGLSVREESAGLRLALQYCIDLFDNSTITGMLAHLKRLLESIANDPERILSDLECLTEDEQRRLLDRRIKRDAPAQVQFGDLELLTNVTPLQFQFWIGQKLNPAMPLYNIVALFTIAGPIDPERFQRAFQTLIDQTDALRTIIEENGEVPHARVLADLPYSMEFVDYSSGADASVALQEWLERHSGRLFELGQRSFESALLKLAEDRYVWYLNIHHIIADGWSFAVIFQRMRRLYQSSLEPPFDEIETPPAFHDYLEEERSYRRSPEYRRDQAYWQKKLNRAAEPLKFYGQAPAAAAAAVRRVTFALGDERVRKIKVIALQPEFTGKTLNVSLFNIFAAVFAAYLYRISGNECISIGTPFLNRSAAYRQTAGLFMQVAPLRLIVSPGETFASLVQKMQAESLAAQKHARFTLRNFQHRFYDAIFNYHNTSFSDFNGAPVEETWLHSGNDTTSLSLHLRNPGDSNLLLQFDFHPEVFDEEQQQWAIDHFRQLLDGFLDDPNQPISGVNLLSEEEKRRLLFEFSQTDVSSSESACIHHLFERQVEQTPHAVALVSGAPNLKAAGRQEMTYRQLNISANQLAHYLRELGVGPDTLVGICVERSLEMAVGVLGILKAGGAYVPLDPHYPADRVAFMLQDAALSVVLTQQRLLSALPATNARMVALDADWSGISKHSGDNPESPVALEHLAYVIYTSGSTGQPKGVLVTHGGVVNHSLAMAALFALRAGDRVSQCNSLSFDISVEELFPCWLSGAAVVLCPSEKFLPDEEFTDWISREEISVLNLPTAFWHEWVYALENHRKSVSESLRLIIVGGDKAASNVVARWQSVAGPQVRWLNTYGPTEGTVTTTVYEERFSSTAEGRFDEIPIGRPIPGAQVYLLNDDLQPVPMGVAGELYIGGSGVARGYLNRPELTGEKFIADPFSKRPGARLYRTGDVCRYLNNGNIEFLDRRDHQVKIRGFRIEPGEIEAVLAQHPALREVVVVAREDDSGDSTVHGTGKWLAAYVTAKEKPAPAVHELRSFLKEQLPAYMVPSAFVFLDVLPLTANGKVDRNALPAYDAARHEQQTRVVAPRDELELQLTKLWEKVLNVRPIGVGDNFFDLGGHSLLAVQLFAQIEKFVGKHLPLAALFQAPTIEQLAGLIRQQDWSAPWNSLVAIQPGGTRPPLFCVHAHDGGVLFWRDLARHLGSDQPFYALQPQGLDGKQPLHSHIEEMAAHYIKEMRNLQPEGPYFIGGHCLGGLIAFEMAQQLHMQGQRVGLLALFDSYAPRREKLARRSLWYRYSRKAIRFFETVNLHIGNLAVLETKERLSYTKAKLNKALYKLYMNLGRRWVPAARNRLKILSAASQAARKYSAKVYPGKITLFRAVTLRRGLDHDAQMGWGRLAGGGLETHLIPGYHAHIVLEPRVRLLAKELAASLRRAEEEFSDGQSTCSAADDETARTPCTDPVF